MTGGSGEQHREHELIGVLGAGVMGAGVAQCLAEAGYAVALIDVDREPLDRAERAIRKDLRFRGLLGKGDAPADPEAVLARIRRSLDLSELGGAVFVIENVTETWAAKEEAYVALDAVCVERCVFASNTSAIPIGRIASATGRADRVIGTHFMNPVPLIGTVEVIRGASTSEETVRRTCDLIASLGKETVIVNDSPGFVSNRVLMLTVNEAIYLVHEGVAPARDVDRLFRQCFGHKMGPLETADMIGLDTIRYSLLVLQEALDDPKFRPCPLLDEMVEAGRLGRKSGEGFHRYAGGATNG